MRIRRDKKFWLIVLAVVTVLIAGVYIVESERLKRHELPDRFLFTLASEEGRLVLQIATEKRYSCGGEWMKVAVDVGDEKAHATVRSLRNPKGWQCITRVVNRALSPEFDLGTVRDMELAITVRDRTDTFRVSMADDETVSVEPRAGSFVTYCKYSISICLIPGYDPELS